MHCHHRRAEQVLHQQIFAFPFSNKKGRRIANLSTLTISLLFHGQKCNRHFNYKVNDDNIPEKTNFSFSLLGITTLNRVHTLKQKQTQPSNNNFKQTSSIQKKILFILMLVRSISMFSRPHSYKFIIFASYFFFSMFRTKTNFMK